MYLKNRIANTKASCYDWQEVSTPPAIAFLPAARGRVFPYMAVLSERFIFIRT